MSHDFANKKKKPTQKKKANSVNKRTKKASKSQVPGWVWLFTGLVAGAFIMFLVQLAEIDPAARPQPEQAASKAKPQDKQPAKQEPKFDFYTLLPEREVIVPPEPEGSSEQRPKEKVIYILQAGSFKQAADADRLRAKLILMGMDTKVEEVGGRGDGSWHRVQVGPFHSQSKMSKARSTLIQQGIDTLLLKRKLES